MVRRETRLSMDARRITTMPKAALDKLMETKQTDPMWMKLEALLKEEEVMEE